MEMTVSWRRTYVESDHAEIESRNSLRWKLVVSFAGVRQDQHILALESKEMNIGKLYGMMSKRGLNGNSHYRHEGKCLLFTTYNDHHGAAQKQRVCLDV